MRALRAIAIGIAFVVFTVPLMPVQALLLAMKSPRAVIFPHWYHRQLAWLLGIRIHTSGSLESARPLLLVANHQSWLDIVVLSAVTPVSFVAKLEVASWPFVGWLAKLQRTLFIDRTRRSSVQHTSRKIAERLTAGDKVIFFPEGTSGDGNRVLPFKSSLFAAVRPPAKAQDTTIPGLESVQVQTVALAYTHASGLPLGRAGRPLVAWYGDMNLASHAWDLLCSGPLDVHVRISAPVPLDDFEDRKALASETEQQVRANVAAMLRHGGQVDDDGTSADLAIAETQDMTPVEIPRPAHEAG